MEVPESEEIGDLVSQTSINVVLIDFQDTAPIRFVVDMITRRLVDIGLPTWLDNRRKLMPLCKRMCRQWNRGANSRVAVLEVKLNCMIRQNLRLHWDFAQTKPREYYTASCYTQ